MRQYSDEKARDVRADVEAILFAAEHVRLHLTDGRTVFARVVRPPSENGMFVVLPWGAAVGLRLGLARVRSGVVPHGLSSNDVREIEARQRVAFGGAR